MWLIFKFDEINKSNHMHADFFKIIEDGLLRAIPTVSSPYHSHLYFLGLA